MKQRDLTRLLEQKGWWLLRHGADHDVWTNGKDTVSIPRHGEINEMLAKTIIKRWGLK